MFNHNFIHKFQPRANGARAVVEAVDMDAFASALRGSFARGASRRSRRVDAFSFDAF